MNPTKCPDTIANIIATLGGGKIFAMAFSSYSYGTSPNPVLTLSIAPSLKRAAKMSHVRVTLMPSDTYKVEFISVRAGKVKTVAELDDVYCDMLKPLVETKTGLYLSL